MDNSVLDLRDLTRRIWLKRWYIIRISFAFVLSGLIIALSIPREFSSIARMVPEESKSILPDNMSNLAAIAGINIDGAKNDGISLKIYPDIVHSTPFIAELITMEIQGDNYKGNLYGYLDKEIKSPWWGAIFRAPFKLLHYIRSKNDKNLSTDINPYHLTLEQNEVFDALKERTSLIIDKKSGIITASVTMQDPVIAASVADSMIVKLEKFVINYRTNKAKQDLEFSSRLYNDAKQSYFIAQKNYAEYIDRNMHLMLESVRIEQERLRNEQMIAYNVYSNLAEQVETYKMKVQEQTPCVTVIEPPGIPVKKSNTSRLFILFAFATWGFLTGIFLSLYPVLKKTVLS